MEGSLTYGAYEHEGERNIDYGSGASRIVRTADSETDSDQFAWSIAAGYNNSVNRFNYSLFARAEGIDADIRLSYGATEAKVPDIVDVAVDITETGRAIKAAGLRIVDTILTSYTEFVANPTSYADPEKRHAMEQLLSLLQGTLEARTKVLVKLNVVSTVELDKVIGMLPSMKAPTVNELYGQAGFAVETVVEKAGINTLIPDLRDAGATDIIELPLSKIIH